NVKRWPPVAVVDRGDWFFYILLAPRKVLQGGALLWMKRGSASMRHEYVQRIAQQGIKGLIIARIGVNHGKRALALEVHRLHKAPIRGDDLPGMNIFQITLRGIHRVAPADCRTIADQFSVSLVGQ